MPMLRELGMTGALQRLQHLCDESLERVPPCAGREELRALIHRWSARLMPQTHTHAVTAAAAR